MSRGKAGEDDADMHFTRCKVYRMGDDGSWVERGMGHITLEYLEKPRAMGLLVLAADEEQPKTLLMHKIVSKNIYTRSEESTIITWQDEDLNTDIALSFAEEKGCVHIWEQIQRVQDEVKKDDPDLASELPMPDLNNLESLLKIVSSAHPFQREQLATALMRPNWIPTLLDLFKQCEDLDNHESLSTLYCLMRSLIMLNDASVLEELLKEEFVMDVVGALEYDPDLKQPQKHRAFLTSSVTFKEVVPIQAGCARSLLVPGLAAGTLGRVTRGGSGPHMATPSCCSSSCCDALTILAPPCSRVLWQLCVSPAACAVRTTKDPAILAKIHQTYRIQYIKDVILPRALDDATYATLSSLVVFNNMEVVTSLAQDPHFLAKLFTALQAADPLQSDWADLVAFLQEFCNLARHVPPTTKGPLLTKLVQLGLYDQITRIMKVGSEAVKLRATDVLLAVLQHDVDSLRTFLLKQKDNMLFSLLVREFVEGSGDGGLAEQVAELLKLLLDSETLGCPVEKSDFVALFYEKFITKILIVIDKDKAVNNKDGVRYVPAHTLGLIVELMCFCVQHHAMRVKYFTLRNHMLKRVISVIHRNERWLACAAVRFLRTCITIKQDEFWSRYLVKNNVFEPIMTAFAQNGERYNLLNSAVLELLDFIRKENMKELIEYLVNTFYHRFEDVEYADTFKALRLKHEQHLDALAEAGQGRAPGGAGGRRGREQRARQVNAPQAGRTQPGPQRRGDYFETDDSEEEGPGTDVQPSVPAQPTAPTASPSEPAPAPSSPASIQPQPTPGPLPPGSSTEGQQGGEGGAGAAAPGQQVDGAAAPRGAEAQVAGSAQQPGQAGSSAATPASEPARLHGSSAASSAARPAAGSSSPSVPWLGLTEYEDDDEETVGAPAPAPGPPAEDGPRTAATPAGGNRRFEPTDPSHTNGPVDQQGDARKRLKGGPDDSPSRPSHAHTAGG
ncbi:SMK-1 domain-containing protein [Haematococcus lacustris]|uniref:SMK-1 domain-containing protein n=1 Tax=Haematococcus lacustris TaxID=44745 RepID=A0A699YVK6_HAELA|nr:SMK-1 domain-containing protein [Haematococcus lacustris]